MNDMNRLEKLDERYGATNMTAFRLVGFSTDPGTVMEHIKRDLEIFNSCDVDYKWVYRVIVRKNTIDICTRDNGTPISYFFTAKAQFSPVSIRGDVENICRELDVGFEDFS